MKYKLVKLKEFNDWYNKQNAKSKSQIDERIRKIIYYGYFGRWKKLGNINELKFNDGRRIYYTIFKSSGTITIIFLLGGNKNGQEKDIWKAQGLIKRDGRY